MNPEFLFEMAAANGLIDSAQIEELKQEMETTGSSPLETLVNYGVFDSQEAALSMIAADLGTDYVDIAGYEPPREILDMVPAGTARLHQAFPIAYDADGLHVVLGDPLNPQTAEDLRFALNQNIFVHVAPPQQVEDSIEKFYGGGADLSAVLGDLGALANSNLSEADIEAEANSAPIIRYVDLVLYNAIREKASDIHFEPFEADFKIRYRVDGALYEMAPPPAHLSVPIISRIKVMANLNIAERRVPQDGRIMKTIAGRGVDMRVSSLPTVHGESMVLRVLDRSSVNLDLPQLDLPPDVDQTIRDTIERPNGIFICTGPTGAGKTTTLYAALREINTIDTKLLTAEDPVEYDIDGIIQLPIQENIGLDFPRALRAFLRQDPDKIMIGEMRDLPTAQIAIQASLTGHLVFSTLHTNDAPGAVTRLIDMGCEPFLVAASLETVLAQRLLRRICKDCASPYDPSQTLLTQLGLTQSDIGSKEFYTGAGCPTCNQTGYKGRRGLFEMLRITDPLRDLITERAPTIVLKQKAIELGMRTLREDGLENIYNGVTTIEEVLKYT